MPGQRGTKCKGYIQLGVVLALHWQLNPMQIFFSVKWDQYFMYGFLCLIKPDSDRISTLEPSIS